jgi:protein phosphatase
MIEVGFKSDKGLKRKNNEDAFFVITEENIFMVADGVGGNNSGEIASRTTVSKIVEYIRKNSLYKDFNELDVKDYFIKCIEKVNKDIYDLSMIQPENIGMATTVAIVYIDKNNAYVTNVGDSRAYLYREETLTQITEDHTYVNALIRKGIITKEEAQFHEKKNIITKAIGGEALTSPDFFCVSIASDDVIVLCTDGLHGEIGDDVICKIVAAGGSMTETCKDLVNKANQCGGRDNITVICLKVKGDY